MADLRTDRYIVMSKGWDNGSTKCGFLILAKIVGGETVEHRPRSYWELLEKLKAAMMSQTKVELIPLI